MTKEIKWQGSSLNDLRSFPVNVRRKAGYELEQAQNGLQPSTWKSINEWGSGVVEIKISADVGAFRVVYVAKFEDAIYVLHCFQKKDQRTSPRDIEIIKMRYNGVVEERSRRKHERRN